MSRIIVFQQVGRPVSIMTPCDCGLNIVEIGQKDVPAGLPFWIIDDSALPEDRSMRNAWQLDVQSMGEAAGKGGTYVPQEKAE